MFLIFASFVVFCIWFALKRKSVDRKERSAEDSYWEREHKANSVRKRSLARLDYITIPDDLEYAGLLPDDPTYTGLCSEIDELKNCKIVNFSGYTNTDLKLEYGTANITVLTEYDTNYTTLVSRLQAMGRILYDAGKIPEATAILEYAVRIGTDVSQTYYLLADIYYQNGTPERVNELISAAQNIRTLMKDSIIKRLSEDPLFQPILIP